MKFTRKNRIIGLNIEPYTINAVHLAESGGVWEILKAEEKKVRITKDEPRLRREIVGALRELFKNSDTRGAKVAAVINSDKTAVKKITTPVIPNSELENAVRYEAGNVFPFSTDGAIIDSEIIGEAEDEGVRKYEVAIAVSEAKTVNEYVSLMNEAGIKPFSLVPAVYAMWALSKKVYAWPKKTVAFLNMGCIYTDLTILSVDEKHTVPTIAFSRKIPVSYLDFLNSLTTAISSEGGTVELSYDEAQTVLADYGIAHGVSPSKTTKGLSEEKMRSLLRNPLDQMVKEIGLCLNFYLEESKGSKVDKLVLFGCASSLKGFGEYVTEHLGIETVAGDPVANMVIPAGQRVPLSIEKSSLSLGIGAALSIGGGINLLPPEVKRERKTALTRATARITATAVILTLILVFVGMKIKLENLQRRLRTAALELSSLSYPLKRAEAEFLASRILVSEPYWEDVFIEISNILPSGTLLTQMDYREGAVHFKGVVYSPEGEEILSKLITDLERGIFKDVSLVHIKDLPSREGNRFELKCVFGRRN